MKEKLQKWERWIEAIYDDMVSSANSRKIYEETRQIVVANPTLADGSTVFFNCLVRWYVDSAVMGLRRQLKINGESISLAGLLKDISKNPHLLSRTHFLSLDQRQEMQKYLNRTFDKYAGEGAEHLDSESIKQELQELRERAKRCEAYADKLVAHLDEQPPKDIPTFQELYDTVDFAETRLKKYYCLLKGSSLTSVTPVVQENWKKVFRIPWLCS
jgi:hypothetical protein